MDSNRLALAIGKRITLSPSESEYLISMFKPRSIRAGRYLLMDGDVCKYLSFVVKGCLKTFYLDDHATEHILDFLVEDWWADDLYSFLTQSASKYHIKAIEDTELLQITKNNLEILYDKIPKIERYFRILFQNAYISQREQINLNLSASAEKRYKLFVGQKPYAEKRFTQKDIASYLGVTPQFFSLMKRKLKNQGKA